MMKKMKNRKGFTLMEMLIVVAIIAILVIIAIPTFTSALSKAKAGTDVANIRSGYAAAQMRAMTEDLDTTTVYLQEDGTVGADGANVYTTQGTSAKAGNPSIGGKFEVGQSGDAGVTWDKDKKIVYTIETKDGVTYVKSITAE